jgi:hypothetical protein
VRVEDLRGKASRLSWYLRTDPDESLGACELRAKCVAERDS